MSAADLAAARVDLAAVYRICAQHGLSEGGTSLQTVSIPGDKLLCTLHDERCGLRRSLRSPSSHPSLHPTPPAFSLQPHHRGGP